MVSGQWTMGAVWKERMCRPSMTEMPSRTSCARASIAGPKNWPIIFLAAAVQTIWLSGCRSKTARSAAQWSGSMWFTMI